MNTPGTVDRNNQVRRELLFQLYAMRPIPASSASIQRAFQTAQLDILRLEIDRELRYLVSAGLMAAENSGTGEVYSLTAKGVQEHERTIRE